MEQPEKPVEREKRILSHLLTKPGVAASLKNFLQETSFQDPWHKEIWTVLQSAAVRLTELPTRLEFQYMFVTASESFMREASSTKMDVLERIKHMFETPTTGATREEIGEWLARDSIKEMAGEIGHGPDLKEFARKVRDRLTSLMPLLTGEAGGSVLPFSDLYMLKNFEDDELGKKDPFPTGYTRIDDELPHGGGRRGDMNTVMAVTGGGKSAMLINLMKNFAEMGRRSLYITMEGGDKEISERLYCNIMRADRKSWPPRKEKERLIHAWLERYKIDPVSQIIIVPLRPKKFTVDGLQAQVHTEAARYGPIDGLFVDYGDLLKPSSKYEQKRHGLEEIFEELTGLADEENLVCWTATQSNRKGLTASTVDMTNTSEAYPKFWPATLGLTITQDPEERKQGRARIAVIKSRRGRSGYEIPFFMNFPQCYMYQDMESRILNLRERKGEEEEDGLQKKMPGQNGAKLHRRSTGEVVA